MCMVDYPVGSWPTSLLSRTRSSWSSKGGSRVGKKMDATVVMLRLSGLPHQPTKHSGNMWAATLIAYVQLAARADVGRAAHCRPICILTSRTQHPASVVAVFWEKIGWATVHLTGYIFDVWLEKKSNAHERIFLFLPLFWLVSNTFLNYF